MQGNSWQRGTAILITSLLLSSCAEDDGGPDGDITVTEGCELFDAGHCLAPFPSNYFTRADSSTATGRRLALAPDSMPSSSAGRRVAPEEWNRSDGFSPGTPIVLVVPSVDLDASGAPPVTNIARSLAPESAVVVVDAASGERHPVWAELDSQAQNGTPQALIIRPATNFKEGRRYVVGLQGLRRSDGSLIEPSTAFRSYRDQVPTSIDAIEARRPSMENVIATLERAGVARAELYLAWDFTVASTASITGRLTTMRNRAFSSLGGDAPRFRITSVASSTNAGVLRVVQGSIDVPKFLAGDGGPGSSLNNEGQPDGIPSRNGTYSAPFVCVVPKSAASRPAMGLLYGHGLLGVRGEAQSVGERLSGTINAVTCGVDWIGMSREDIPTILASLTDLTRFRTVPDRLQQAMLNFLFVGRALRHPRGFASHSAFRSGGRSVVSGEVAFVGFSQGGILGGALSAVAQDWERSVLGLAGMNYSTLLQRSIDFDYFAPFYAAAYPSSIDQQIGFALMQMLWDRGEGNGYAQHLTRQPLGGTPAKQVLLYVAFGDHQVTNVASDVLARTARIPLREPALRGGRSRDVTPFWRVPRITSYPHFGSGYVMWDFGTPPPPVENRPNRAGDDPHGAGRNDPRLLQLVDSFLRTGQVVDVCGGGPCTTP